MRKRILYCAVAAVCLTAVAVQSQFAVGQGSGSSRSTPSRPARPQTTEEFAESLWRFIVRPQSPYTKWTAVPARKVERPSDISNAHGMNARIYANPTASQDPTAPAGSIFVIDDYLEDGKTRNNVSIMYRAKGTAPQHGDWYWLRYLPNGSIARSDGAANGKPVAGKVRSCIDCHEKAGGNDFVFSNDAE